MMESLDVYPYHPQIFPQVIQSLSSNARCEAFPLDKLRNAYPILFEFLFEVLVYVTKAMHFYSFFTHLL